MREILFFLAGCTRRVDEKRSAPQHHIIVSARGMREGEEKDVCRTEQSLHELCIYIHALGAELLRWKSVNIAGGFMAVRFARGSGWGARGDRNI